MAKVCKECKYIFPLKYGYCPYCGKRLENLSEEELKRINI